jgi:hypothetical protein
MAQDDKKETVTLEREKFDRLLTRLDALEKAEKDRASKGPGIETAAMRLLRDSENRMREEPQAIQQAKLKLVDEPATNDGNMPLVNQDKCAWCLKQHMKLYAEAKKAGQTYEVLDLTNGGKYACRRCGKHWHPWAIFPEDGSEGPLPYSIHLERGDKDKVEELEKLRAAKAGLPVSIK